MTGRGRQKIRRRPDPRHARLAVARMPTLTSHPESELHRGSVRLRRRASRRGRSFAEPPGTVVGLRQAVAHRAAREAPGESPACKSARPRQPIRGRHTHRCVALSTSSPIPTSMGVHSWGRKTAVRALRGPPARQPQAHAHGPLGRVRSECRPANSELARNSGRPTPPAAVPRPTAGQPEAADCGDRLPGRPAERPFKTAA